jgi:hypothetical protein
MGGIGIVGEMFQHKSLHIGETVEMSFFLSPDILDESSKVSVRFVLDADYKGGVLSFHRLSSETFLFCILAQPGKQIVIGE